MFTGKIEVGRQQRDFALEKFILVSSLKKIQQKAFEKWQLTLVLLMGLIVANIYLVQNILTHEVIYPEENLILKTYKTVGNCFYKKADSKKWLYLSGQEIISTGSELRVSEQSNAILTFMDQNGRFEVSEKTHIGIFTQGKDPGIEFKKGEIFINFQASASQPPLLVNVDGRIFSFKNADLYIYGDIEEQVYISVEYGRVSMVSGPTQTVFEKGNAILFKDKEYVVEESRFQITTPFNYDRYNIQGEKRDVRFAFGEFEEDYDFQLLVGSSAENLRPVFDSPQALSKNEIVWPFQKGFYYWQLVAFKDGQQEFVSQVKKFFVEPQSPAQRVSPADGARFQILHGAAPVQFQWDNPSQLEKVFIEVSQHPDFSRTLIHESTLENNYFNYEFQHPGKYYWRVSGFPFGTSDLVPSTVGEFDIVNEVVPQNVQITFPKNKSTLTTQSLQSSDISFQWSTSLNATQFEVQIQSLDSNNEYRYTTEDQSIKVSELPEGSYQWIVRDVIRDVASPSEEFRVVQTRRLRYDQISEKSAFLSWRPGPRGTSQYRVEVLRIGSRSDFNAFFDSRNASKRTLEISGREISYRNFSPGIYAFKVYALDGDKQIIADSNLQFLKVND